MYECKKCGNINTDEESVCSECMHPRSDTWGLKYDQNKLRMDLIPPETYEALGRVLTYGAGKYSPNSWQGVASERYVGALLRHFVAYMKEPSGVDEESGLKHIEHVLANAMFLNWMCNVKENK